MILNVPETETLSQLETQPWVHSAKVPLTEMAYAGDTLVAAILA